MSSAFCEISEASVVAAVQEGIITCDQGTKLWAMWSGGGVLSTTTMRVITPRGVGPKHQPKTVATSSPEPASIPKPATMLNRSLSPRVEALSQPRKTQLKKMPPLVMPEPSVQAPQRLHFTRAPSLSPPASPTSARGPRTRVTPRGPSSTTTATTGATMTFVKVAPRLNPQKKRDLYEKFLSLHDDNPSTPPRGKKKPTPRAPVIDPFRAPVDKVQKQEADKMQNARKDIEVVKADLDDARKQLAAAKKRDGLQLEIDNLVDQLAAAKERVAVRGAVDHEHSEAKSVAAPTPTRQSVPPRYQNPLEVLNASHSGNPIIDGNQEPTRTCPSCSRAFKVSVAARHEEICRRQAMAPRKVFDSAKQRATAEAAAAAVSSNTIQTTTKTPPKVPKWQAQHEQLQAAMRSLKTTTEHDTRVPCPHCQRRFSETVSLRHIPKCKDILNKPKTLSRKML